jgi:HD-GYP domain-containing protein (c-di-GMP phosphodiesterase class II)
VADTFDAITSDRIYSQARSYEEAVRELEDWSGRQFDPQVVEAFRRIPPEEWAELRRTAEHISFAESAALSAQHDSYLELSRPANSEFLFSRSYKSLAAAL